MTIKGVRVAILIDDGLEEVEMTRPRQALDKAGAETKIVSPAGAQVRAWVNEPVVVDGNLVTSRKPDDIPEFDRAMI